MSQRPQVIWVTAESPNRAGGGGNIRQSYLLERLARDADVHLLLAGDPPDAMVAAAVRSIERHPAGPRPLPASTVGRRFRLLADAVLPGGPSEARSARPARQVLDRMLARRASCDVVIVEHTGLAPLIRRQRQGERWLLTMHNVPSASARHALEMPLGRRQAWTWRRELRAAQELERHAIEEFDAVFTVGANDAAELSRPAVVIPNGVDTTKFTPLRLPGTRRVVFTGTLNYLPNVDGLVWFCRDVWPIVRAALPDAEFVIAGRAPTDQVVSLAGDGIELHPNPDEIVPFLDSAQVAVVPLRQGSGTRLKALEAMARGRPVIGTTLGLDGLGIQDGRDALVRDHAADMAAGIVQLLRDPAAADRLAQRGPRFVRPFSWETVSATFVEQVLGRVDGEEPRCE
jgi:glycosyltransferase involved in cell wall biosynthesis